MGYFGVGVGFKNFFEVSLSNDFCFLSFALFLLYHVILSLWWVVVGVVGVGIPAMTFSQLNYNYGCFVVWVVVVVGL